MHNPRGPGPRHVSATAPVNRRTARGRVAEEAPLSLPPDSVAAARQRQSAARALLGIPLAERIAAAQPALRAGDAPASSAGPARVGLALLTAAAGAGIVLGAVQSSLALGAAGAVGLLAAAGWSAAGRFRDRRRAAAATPAALAMPPAFEAATLRRLDELLATVAPQVPPGVCAQLVDLKDRFVRIATLLARADAGEHVPSDDRMYLIEAERRYLPDTLRAFLAVPLPQRHDRPLEEGGATALALLADQLALLQSELQLREDQLARAAGAALLRQQRFLRSKVGSREG
ncbi:MAG: hypothetical protein ABI212_06875 [Burkholderiaceae bacterium]